MTICLSPSRPLIRVRFRSAAILAAVTVMSGFLKVISVDIRQSLQHVWKQQQLIAQRQGFDGGRHSRTVKWIRLIARPVIDRLGGGMPVRGRPSRSRGGNALGSGAQRIG